MEGSRSQPRPSRYRLACFSKSLAAVPPSDADPLEFLQSSGLRELAEKKRLYVHVLVPTKPWQEDADAADFLNAVYAAVQGRDYYVTMQDNIYACGFGDGASVAHTACAKMASEWSGLFTFGDLSGALALGAETAQSSEQGGLELKIEAKQAQLPVWIVAERESENVRKALEYWKGQNDVSPEPLSGQGADKIWQPQPMRKYSEVNEEHVAQVRLTLGSTEPSPEKLENVWSYIGMARRHSGYGKKILRVFKDPIACGATKHEMTYKGMARTWYEYVPARCTPDKKWPLVLCMHGRGGTAETFFDISCMSLVAEDRGFHDLQSFDAAAVVCHIDLSHNSPSANAAHFFRGPLPTKEARGPRPTTAAAPPPRRCRG